MENRTAIRLRIAQLRYQRARIDAELAQLRTADRPPRASSLRLDVPLIKGPVRHRRRSDGEAN
jgi:hypothetical protein